MASMMFLDIGSELRPQSNRWQLFEWPTSLKAPSSNPASHLAGLRNSISLQVPGDLQVETWPKAVINIGWVKLYLDNGPTVAKGKPNIRLENTISTALLSKWNRVLVQHWISRNEVGGFVNIELLWHSSLRC